MQQQGATQPTPHWHCTSWKRPNLPESCWPCFVYMVNSEKWKYKMYSHRHDSRKYSSELQRALTPNTSSSIKLVYLYKECIKYSDSLQPLTKWAYERLITPIRPNPGHRNTNRVRCTLKSKSWAKSFFYLELKARCQHDSFLEYLALTMQMFPQVYSI